MSNKTRLEAVSSALDAAINTANSLPDAGGGGGSIETCTVTIECPNSYQWDVCYSVYDGSSIYGDCRTFCTSAQTLENVVCGSVISVFEAGVTQGFSVLDDTMEFVYNFSGSMSFTAPTISGATATATLNPFLD